MALRKRIGQGMMEGVVREIGCLSLHTFPALKTLKNIYQRSPPNGNLQVLEPSREPDSGGVQQAEVSRQVVFAKVKRIRHRVTVKYVLLSASRKAPIFSHIYMGKV